MSFNYLTNKQLTAELQLLTVHLLSQKLGDLLISCGAHQTPDLDIENIMQFIAQEARGKNAENGNSNTKVTSNKQRIDKTRKNKSKHLSLFIIGL